MGTHSPYWMGIFTICLGPLAGSLNFRFHVDCGLFALTSAAAITAANNARPIMAMSVLSLLALSGPLSLDLLRLDLSDLLLSAPLIKFSWSLP